MLSMVQLHADFGGSSIHIGTLTDSLHRGFYSGGCISGHHVWTALSKLPFDSSSNQDCGNSLGYHLVH